MPFQVSFIHFYSIQFYSSSGQIAIKNYYTDITHNNLDLIKSLKEEVKELEAEDSKVKFQSFFWLIC